MAGSTGLGTARIVALAAIAGILVGGIALYVSGALDGNTPPTPSSVAEANDTCPAKAAAAKALGAAAVGEVAAMLPADPPQSLAGLAFDNPEGRRIVLGDLSGKALLVNLWATWCAPCRAEMPALDELERQMGGEGFEVVAINVDTGSDEKPRAFLEEIGVSALGFYRDASMGVFNDLKKRSLALGLPVTLLVDSEGCLLSHMNGPAEWAGPDARRFVEAAIAPGS